MITGPRKSYRKPYDKYESRLFGQLKNSIYLTGIHRSGTSWIGKMLSFGGKFILKDEEIFNLSQAPSNTLLKRGIVSIKELNSPINHWFLQIYEENEHQYLDYIERILTNRYLLLAALSSAKNLSHVKTAFFAKKQSLKLRQLGRKHPSIIIEPIGLLSTDWFYNKFGLLVIVTIRHPASFVSSLKRLNWKFDFHNFIDQDHLMAGRLQRYQGELEDSIALTDDIIGQGILLWRLLYSVVKEYQEQYPEWIYIRHEDLASDPIGGFRSLYKLIGLNFTPMSRAKILEFSGDSNPSESPVHNPGMIRRSSRDTVRIWNQRLEKDEIERIKEGVWSVASNWYGEEDW